MVSRRRFACLLGLVLLAIVTEPWALAASPDHSPADRGNPRGLVIVAPQQFEGELQTYLEHKRQDLRVELAILENVIANTRGVDLPEKVKRFLYGAWKERNIRYVLLVGDVSTFPMRYFAFDRITPAAHDTAFDPSDLYYADVAKSDGSFDDWQAHKEGHHRLYFGEVHGEKIKSDPINFDRINYRPKLAVGRWPASSPGELRIIVAKSIAFENQLNSGKKRPPQAGMVAVGGWIDSRDRLNQLAASLSKKWRVHKRYYSEKDRKPSTPPPTEAEVIKLLDRGVDLLIHCGHGSNTSWQDCFSVDALDRISNAGRLPVIISAGCSTAKLSPEPPYQRYVDIFGVDHKGTNAGEVFKDFPPPPAPLQQGRMNWPGLGKQFLMGGPDGAVAYIGCVTGGQPWGLTLVEGFTKAWAQGKGQRLGDCWVEAISYYYDKEHLATLKPNNSWEPNAIFHQAMKYLVYGDPSLRLPR